MCRNNYFDRASQEQTAVQISALWTAKGILFTDVDKMLKGECRMNAGYTLAVYYIAISREPKDDEGEKSWFSGRVLHWLQSQDHRKEGWAHGSGVILLEGICVGK